MFCYIFNGVSFGKIEIFLNRFQNFLTGWIFRSPKSIFFGLFILNHFFIVIILIRIRLFFLRVFFLYPIVFFQRIKIYIIFIFFLFYQGILKRIFVWFNLFFLIDFSDFRFKGKLGDFGYWMRWLTVSLFFKSCKSYTFVFGIICHYKEFIFQHVFF